ncbi:hypothetical protein AWH56_020405 [Anaerobacillus isosaccharinicus]|uniref:Uncharacterized protein n=1 Tax=Anaerobacillus isosaccharinicus TaxID=1532552 RepID=A0A7S7L5W4_9BACI|nr:hypothetical protein [Anaerobacillus isosaccharinicus]MBA5586730.1 hypothetical protein [Anaerobacillus isosaccharinicus]QOY35048.1 hypothetical protein AWH56_020405 [Anaerobacillus isosaccharinicus]
MVKITTMIVSLSIIFTLILLLTLGVYNPYHHLNAEKIVRLLEDLIGNGAMLN